MDASLLPEDLPDEPQPLFDAWMALAEENELNDPNAMSLATVGGDGMPSVRVVLLKGRESNGFVFYTNYESRKGRELLQNPKAALCFHWKSLRRQIRIEGEISPVTDAEADAYFATRSRGSRVGAWASRQSQPLESRAVLEAAAAVVEARHEGREIPRPPNWSGFRVYPLRIEFWADGAFRLHDRFLYERVSDGWTITRLSP